MKETARYSDAKEYLSKHMVFEARFQKYGMVTGQNIKATCLVNVRIPGSKTELIDHIWCDSEELVDAKLRTGQAITIKGTLGTRKRPSTETPDLELDLRLSKVKFISKKGKKR